MLLNNKSEIEVYTPHSGPLLLVDRVLNFSDHSIETETDVSEKLPFFAEGSIPSYLGLEIMAQSIAVWSGLRRGRSDTKPPIGYLLGTRKFQCKHPYIKEGAVLKTKSEQLFENEGLASFNCNLTILTNQEYIDLVTAKVSVYSDPEG